MRSRSGPLGPSHRRTLAEGFGPVVRKSLISVAGDSFPVAKAELFQNVDDVIDVRRVGERVAVVETSSSTAGDLAAVIRTAPLVFPRHITDIVAEFDPVDSTLASVADQVDAVIREHTDGSEIALQVWLSGRVPYEFNRYNAWKSASRVLDDLGHRAVRVGPEFTLSVCFAPKAAIVGFNRTEDSLSSWPGGEVRLSRPPEQVSRAEFKLEELFKCHPLPLDPHWSALDFGAAPGGWTRILAGHGLRVTAVDPGDLDPRVRDLDGVEYVKTTAGNFVRNERRRFDLIVNDMKMNPVMSSRLIAEGSDLLKPSGFAVLTLKTGDRGVLAQIDESFAVLREKFTIEFARQLEHNRKEVTVVLRKRS